MILRPQPSGKQLSYFRYPREPKWYVVYVKSRAEKKVKDRFDRAGIEAFLPLIKVMRQWSDRRKAVWVPLFGSYVFIHVGPDAFTAVRMVEGVVHFVSQEGRFAHISEEQISIIRRFLDTGIHMEASTDHFSPGEKVRITFGPMQGCAGELIEIKNTKHFIVRIGAISQVLKISMPPAYLEKI